MNAAASSVAAKLQQAADECRVHASVLMEALEDLPAGYQAADITGIGRLERRVLDQLAYRFIKLQDTLGQRLLPLLLEQAEEPLPPDTPFAQKLQRLERLGWIPAAEDWRRLRIARNTIAHEYPDLPEIRAALLNRLLQDTQRLLDFHRHVARHAPAA